MALQLGRRNEEINIYTLVVFRVFACNNRRHVWINDDGVATGGREDFRAKTQSEIVCGNFLILF